MLVAEALKSADREFRNIYFRPEFGNAGDALINIGFYSMASRLGLKYREITGGRRNVPELGPGDLLILAGGGSLNPYWEDGLATIRALTTTPATLLYLPQTLHECAAEVALLRPRDMLFVRERRSLDYARELAPACQIHLDHDMALSADVDHLRAAPLHRFPRDVDEARRGAALARLRLLAARGQTLQCWRSDSERRDRTTHPRRREDLPILTNLGTTDRALNTLTARWLLEVLSWFRAVETDRLHVGIGCALLGIPVRLHANHYHKIRSVYEYSLRDHPDYSRLVTFVED